MSSEGFGYEEEGAGTLLLVEVQESKRGDKAPREAPSWRKEAVAGRVLSEGGRGLPMPGGGQEWPDMG